MLKYLIEKEFKQILRNPILPRLILVFPLMALLILPLAANYEIKNINLCVVDNDQSPYSRKLVEKIRSSGYFVITKTAKTYDKGLEAIEYDDADVVTEIPKNFEKELIREGKGKVLISANAVNGMKGGLSSSYLSSIVTDFAGEVRSEWIEAGTGGGVPVIEIMPLNRFNQNLDYHSYMVPAIMVMLLTMICGFLPALNIVSEKEAGTIEQINVTPIRKFTFIISKLIPYWIIGIIVLTIGFGVAAVGYNLLPAGSFGTIYVFAAVYVLAVSGFGLLVSNYSETLQQALFVIFFFVIIFILISGLYTPIKSMPEWAQTLTVINPLRYFIEMMRSVYLKGSGLFDLQKQMIALLIFAGLFNVLAVVSYRKRQ